MSINEAQASVRDAGRAIVKAGIRVNQLLSQFHDETVLGRIKIAHAALEQSLSSCALAELTLEVALEEPEREEE